ncbi:MAG TPA: hypothetical protein VGK58_06185, partial [Lacipirellulaceae bacterium]
MSQFAGHSLSINGQSLVRRAPGNRAGWPRRPHPFTAFLAILALLATLADSQPGWAVVVGNVPNVVPNVTSNPASFPGWTHGDPGFNNLSAVGNYVYLGDGWVLSARHVGYNKINGIKFETASG